MDEQALEIMRSIEGALRKARDDFMALDLEYLPAIESAVFLGKLKDAQSALYALVVEDAGGTEAALARVVELVTGA